MRGLRPLMIAFAVLSGTAFADSVSLSFSPFSQNVTAGQTISVQVQISGLGNFAVPSVGSFDLFVSFDPTLLSPKLLRLVPCWVTPISLRRLRRPSSRRLSWSSRRSRCLHQESSLLCSQELSF